MTALANARPGVIESVLWSLKQALEAREAEKKTQVYFDDGSLPDIVANPDQAAVDRKLLLDKIKECEEQAEYIDALESKISKLEELMKLKDAKIAKLEQRAEK
jgi:hypothetical protein